MALRTLNIFLCTLLLLAAVPFSAQACFGPKLFVAAGQSLEEETLHALVTLYVVEKTGVESNFVTIKAGEEPRALIADDKADLVFAAPGAKTGDTVFAIDGLPTLVTGKRPLEDLQFTTVLPAIRKLEKLLSRNDVMSLVARVKTGESAKAAARSFLMERRWI